MGINRFKLLGDRRAFVRGGCIVKGLPWFTFNGALFACFFLGFYGGVAEAKNIALLMMWFSAVLGSLLLIQPLRASLAGNNKDKDTSVPLWVSTQVGLLILAMAASQAMYILCVFCFLRIIGYIEYYRDLDKSGAVS